MLAIQQAALKRAAAKWVKPPVISPIYFFENKKTKQD
jgi:hypothetical protein